MDLVNDKANYEVVCDGAIAGTSVIDPWIVTKKFATAKESIGLSYALVGTVDTVTRALEANMCFSAVQNSRLRCRAHRRKVILPDTRHQAMPGSQWT